MEYCQTLLEDKVQEIYEGIDIYQPHQIDIEKIAARLGHYVEYAECKPYSTLETDRSGFIVLDSREDERKQWEAFAHELCHVMTHAGNQFGITESFREYQEDRARLFTLKFCLPVHMFAKYIDPLPTRTERIYTMYNLFPVTPELAERRLNSYEGYYQLKKG